MVTYKYLAFFKKNTTDFHIVLDTNFEKYEEMSDGLRKYYGYDNKFGTISIEHDEYLDRRELVFDYRYFFFDFIQDTSILDSLYIASKSTGLIRKNIEYLQDKCKEYLLYNDFDIDFFEKFTSSKRIFISRVLTQENATRLNLEATSNEIGYRYESNDINAIVFACVHFALTNGYNTVMKCKHCERYFFTHTQKEEYCKRLSPCFNMVDSGTEVLGGKSSCATCANAVNTIIKRFQTRKKTIYNKWYNGNISCEWKCENCQYEDCIIDEERTKTLCANYKKLKKDIINSPTVENIIKLHRYLYSDEMPKQERPNRRKNNAEKRLLKKDGVNNGNDKQER